MKICDDWEFNVAGIYNYNKPGTKYNYFEFIKNNHDKLTGDIIEAGVYRGRSLLATGLLLKELGSDKKVYGFDSFSGFPPIYHANDDLGTFKSQLHEGKITEEHFQKIEKYQILRSMQTDQAFSSANISQSGDFSESPLDLLKQKINLFELDNIEVVEGPFAETMLATRQGPSKVMAALLDCDLYESYQTTLPFVWQKLVHGGYIFLDEYYSLKFPGARIATDEYFADKQDKPSMHPKVPGDFERWYVMKNSAE